MPILNKDFQSQAGNPLDKEKEAVPIESVMSVYKQEDKDYLSFVQQRLENAKRQKDAGYPEFGNKNYHQMFMEREAIANTMLPAKKNEDDVVLSAGTVEAKLHALLSSINNLDLSAEYWAFDEENNRLIELGVALTDILRHTEELDGGDGGGDEEKKIQRQLELLKQGTVFVQEEWIRTFKKSKKLKSKYEGQFSNFEGWTETLEIAFEGCSRNLLYGPNVYLGNITEFYMENQPFVFVRIASDYEVAKARYGKFENWVHVVKGNVSNAETKTIYDNKWRLAEVQSNEVEILLYQDKFRDEFQIIINGVMMLPVGFPLSAVSPGGDYNIAKQVYRIINSKFAYGKAFVDAGSVKELSKIIDEMLMLFVLKTRKSFAPPMINTSGRIISRKVLSPGRISMGISPDALQMIGEQGQGVTAAESAVLEKLEDLINKSTVSDQFTGNQGARASTATEILELQRQAKLTLGLTITVCGLLEKKLAYLRLYNIIENYFNPIDEKVVEDVQEARKIIKKQYRVTTRETNIEGAGMGERKVIPTDGPEIPDPTQIRQEERDAENEKGIPHQIIYINAEKIKNARLLWYAVVNPREKESSPFLKVQFREMLNDMVAMLNMGSKPNISAIEDEFSHVWKKSRNKLFMTATDIAASSPAEGPGAGGAVAPAGETPQLPNAEGIPKAPAALGMA